MPALAPGFMCIAGEVLEAAAVPPATAPRWPAAARQRLAAVAHEAGMRLMDRALCYDSGGRAMKEGDSVEACRLANAAARLLTVYQTGLLTLQKLRTGGTQTVTVQHVNVQPGGQAVIGNVGGGGGERRGSE